MIIIIILCTLNTARANKGIYIYITKSCCGYVKDVRAAMGCAGFTQPNDDAMKKV